MAEKEEDGIENEIHSEELVAAEILKSLSQLENVS
jgi:hypothetical protein